MPRSESDDTDITDDEIIPKEKATAYSRKNKKQNKKVVKTNDPSKPVVNPTAWRRFIHWLEIPNNLGYLQGILVINTVLVNDNSQTFFIQISKRLLGIAIQKRGAG